MKKVFYILIACALLLLVLAGCGGKKTAEPSAPAAEESAAEAGPAEGAAAEDVPAEASPAEAALPADSDVEPAPESDFTIRFEGDDGCAVIGCVSDADVLKVPETIEGRTVVGIGKNGLGNIPARRVILPDTVEFIEAGAFPLCENLRTVALGSGLKSIGYLAFGDCASLETVTFPEGLVTLDGPFGFCGALGEVYIPATVTEIPNNLITYPDFCPNIVIVTPAGSLAETVAAENGLTVKNP